MQKVRAKLIGRISPLKGREELEDQKIYCFVLYHVRHPMREKKLLIKLQEIS